MAPAEACFEEDLPTQLDRFRADLRRQFGGHCLSFLVALLFVLALSSFALWAVAGTAVWALILCVEAKSTFGRLHSTDSHEFCRWQRRQYWVAARNGDRRSLRRLQNVQ